MNHPVIASPIWHSSRPAALGDVSPTLSNFPSRQRKKKKERKNDIN
jgi:hypothetical protein